MKKIIDIISATAIGILLGVSLGSEQDTNNYSEVYANRNIESELKAEIDRVTLILNSSEDKYIKTNIPKPKPPSPVECTCGGAKEIVHGDGHKTPCPCGANCVCTPKATPQ